MMRWNIEEVRDLKEALVCDKNRKPLTYTCCIELIETIEGLYDDVDSLMEQLNRNIYAMDDAEAKIEALQQENEQLKEQINTAKIGWDTYKTYSEQLEQQTAESNKIIEAQQQEIDRLKELLADWKYNAKCDADHIAALTADKDEQAGRIMEQDTLLKESRDLFNDVRGILKDVGRLFQASQKQAAATATIAFIIIIDALNKKIDALLGGKEDV